MNPNPNNAEGMMLSDAEIDEVNSESRDYFGKLGKIRAQAKLANALKQALERAGGELNFAYPPETSAIVGTRIDKALACIRAALAESPSNDGWETMETAPKDGTRVLGSDPHRGVAICHMERSGKWYPSDEAEKFDGFFQPEAWQPLPKPKGA